MRALIVLLFIPLAVQSLSYVDDSASTNGTQSIRVCSDITPWGRYGTRYNSGLGDPFPNDGYGNTGSNGIPGLKWVNGWYQGSAGTSYVKVDNRNTPVTYSFWTSTGGRGLWEDGAGCRYHMLAPTWLMLGNGLSFNLDAYGGQAACNFTRRQNTALFTQWHSLPIYATSPADASAYGNDYYNKELLADASVYDDLPITSTPRNRINRNVEYRTEHWAIAVNAYTYAVFLNGKRVPVTPRRAVPAPDLTNQFVKWPSPDDSYKAANNMLDFLDLQIYVGVDMTTTAGNIFSNGACMLSPPPPQWGWWAWAGRSGRIGAE